MHHFPFPPGRFNPEAFQISHVHQRYVRRAAVLATECNVGGLFSCQLNFFK